MLKRIGLFLATNVAIIVVISILLSFFNVQPYMTRNGLNYQSLFIYAAIVGFTGAFISLFISKWMAKMAYSIEIIDRPGNRTEEWLFSTVKHLASENGIGMPEVGIYDSAEPNAFATGWNRNSALVAVSTGLLEYMDEDELEGVLAHEVAHVANGDMVTLTLIQGVVNTFVIFFARIAAFLVSQFFRGNDENESSMSSSFAYYGIAMLFEILFGILATMIVMWFSRYREFRADSGSADHVGSRKMIKALQKLQRLRETPVDPRGKEFATMKISGRHTWMKFFSSHPPLEKRIAALEHHQ
ncbi:MAG: protease HtpX [SAR324 cluster bacterium]|nr:protease HtpX [SAR324 cluster bacterium]